MALPFVAALVIALVANGSRALHSGVAAAASAAGLILLASMAGPVIAGAVPSAMVSWVPSLGLELTLMVDPLGLMFAGLILGIGLLVVIFGHFYLYEGEATGRFFASLMLFQGAMLGIVLAGNVLLLLVFWELTSLSSFLLIGFLAAQGRSTGRSAHGIGGDRWGRSGTDRRHGAVGRGGGLFRSCDHSSSAGRRCRPRRFTR